MVVAQSTNLPSALGHQPGQEGHCSKMTDNTANGHRLITYPPIQDPRAMPLYRAASDEAQKSTETKEPYDRQLPRLPMVAPRHTVTTKPVER